MLTVKGDQNGKRYGNGHVAEGMEPWPPKITCDGVVQRGRTGEHHAQSIAGEEIAEGTTLLAVLYGGKDK